MVISLPKKYDLENMYTIMIDNIINSILISNDYLSENQKNDIINKILLFLIKFFKSDNLFNDQEYLDLSRFLSKIKVQPISDKNILPTGGIFPLLLVLKNLSNNIRISGDMDIFIHVLTQKINKGGHHASKKQSAV